MSEQEIYLDECKLIYLENWGYSFYYEDASGQTRGVKFPRISLKTTGWSMYGSGNVKLSFETNSGSLFLVLELQDNDNVCGGYSSKEYINMINNYSNGRQERVVLTGTINGRSFEIPVNQIEDGKLKLYASDCGLNLWSDSCPFSITNLRLYDNEGLRPSNEGYSFDCTFEVRSGSIGTCPPSIPNFDCGILSTSFYSGEYIKWEGFTTSVSSTSTSTCKARINGENVSLGQQKAVYNATGSYRYLVIN
jgi:hypothetical protein